MIISPDKTQDLLVLFEKYAVLRLSKPKNGNKFTLSNNDLQIIRGQLVDSENDVGRENCSFNVVCIIIIVKIGHSIVLLNFHQ